jgi:threonine synthase
MTDDRWARRLVCSKTGVTAPLDEPAFVSPAGAPWMVEYDLDPDKGEALRRALPGRPWTLWRYRELLPVADFAGRVDLGEGATPVIRLRRFAPEGIELWLKDEAGNPTGSFKARGLSMAVNRARELGAPGVALPADTPRTVFERCREYGAEVLSGPGTLVEAARLLEEGKERFWGLSTLREPYRAEGKKTMGLELAEQFGWELPDWIVYPLGGGTGIVGMHKAFSELEQLGLIGPRRPRFVAVQAAGCAPIVRAWEAGQDAAEPWENPDTRVWGLRVPRAIGDFLVLKALYATGGSAIAVDEKRLDGITSWIAAHEGLRIGPEGAAALAAVEDLEAAGAFAPGERVVVFQTGDPANYV